MQRKFIDRLDIRFGGKVFGTIDPANLPSKKTAQRVGRQVLETGVFIDLK